MVDNGRTAFSYATSLPVTASYLIDNYGTADSGHVRRVKITDITVLGTGAPRSVRFSGQGGPEQDIKLKVATSQNLSVSFNTPYPLSAVSSTTEVRGIYGSANAVGTRVIVTGFVDNF